MPSASRERDVKLASYEVNPCRSPRSERPRGIGHVQIEGEQVAMSASACRPPIEPEWLHRRIALALGQHVMRRVQHRAEAQILRPLQDRGPTAVSIDTRTDASDDERCYFRSAWMASRISSTVNSTGFGLARGTRSTTSPDRDDRELDEFTRRYFTIDRPSRAARAANSRTASSGTLRMVMALASQH